MFNNIIRHFYTSTFVSSIKTNSHRGPKLNELRVKTKQTSQRMSRRWQRTAVTGPESSKQKSQKEYTLLSYNILAQDLLIEHNFLYYNTDVKWLRWEHRLRRLTQEINHLNPDILCLQEMQYSHLKLFVKCIKGNRQLEYLFKKKTGHRTDGCAIIYDRSKFKLQDDNSLEYYTRQQYCLDRENVAILAKFNLREEPTKSVVIATTHLLYNPKRHDVRCAQVDKLLDALQTFSEPDVVDHEQNSCKNNCLPIILTGDFNCQPYSSPFCRLVTPRRPPRATEPANGNAFNLKKDNYAECLQLVPISFGGENCASSFQQQWVVVDYILHSIGRINVSSIYKLPSVVECISVGEIPNKYLGSDHYSLAFRFSVS